MLQLRDIRKAYKVADFTQVALDDVSIAFRDNEFVAILGPSGSGKTTMLNVIGGLDHYDSGSLIIDGIDTSRYTDRDWDAYRNNRIGFVFQSYNLIPHQSVLSNVELALTLTGVSRAERRARATAALEEVGLGEHIHKLPSQLSGGQMQRVAIARALINDPEILLADEPTGALDSETSVAIMALLTQIAKDRLVVMVTHNPELADQYATRTVDLRDGRVEADSDPFDPEAEAAKTAKASRRTAMSFWTAIALSFKNLMTKKGRTLMTAFAGSIGIIGIATILALANGVNNYVKSVEEDTLSVYPLSIQSQGMDIAGLLGASAGEESAEDAVLEEDEMDVEDGSVTEVQMLSRFFSSVGSNDLAALKTYLDNGGGNIDEYTNLIQYSYNVVPQIFREENDGDVRQVNPDTTFSALGFGPPAGASGMMGSSMMMNAFSEMMDDSSLIEQQYDVVAGDWPKSYDETLLVLTPLGSVSDFVLYALGIRDAAELDVMVTQMLNEETVTAPQGGAMEVPYQDILDVKFKLVNAADYYAYDTTYEVWTDKSGDAKFLKSLVDEGETLRVSGILAPREGVTATALPPGIYYTSGLVDHLIDEAAQTEIVKEQVRRPAINVFTGRSFADEAANPQRDDFDMSKLVSIDQDAIAAAFQFDESMLSLDLSGLDFASSGLPNLSFDPGMLPTLNIKDLVGDLDIGTAVDIDLEQILAGIDLSGIDLGVAQEEVIEVASDLAAGYAQYCMEGNDCTDPAESFQAFLATPAGLALQDRIEELSDDLQSGLESIQQDLTNQLVTAITKSVQDQIVAASDTLQTQLQSAMTVYMRQAMSAISTQVQNQIGSALQQQISSSLQGAMAGLAQNMSAAMSIDEEAFADAFSFNIDEAELGALMMAMLSDTQSSFDANIARMGYADYARPYSIDIYPKDFEAKGQVVKVLDDYNAQMEAEGQDERVITYTDIVGALMSSVTDIINIISYVLVAFVAISLIVSSIMIGVITYISVLERKKEIGILRSIGASKKDIRRVFNAETLIVGFVAGVLGITVTLVITLVADAIVYARFGIPQVAILPWQAGVILILVSMGLTYMAGLIPSSAASRKDPVEALRSE